MTGRIFLKLIAGVLGLAVRNEMVLVTMDKGIVYLAGSEFSKHVLLLQAS